MKVLNLESVDVVDGKVVIKTNSAVEGKCSMCGLEGPMFLDTDEGPYCKGCAEKAIEKGVEMMEDYRSVGCYGLGLKTTSEIKVV